MESNQSDNDTSSYDQENDDDTIDMSIDISLKNNMLIQAKSNTERILINTLFNLHNEMSRYRNDVKMIWNTHIKNFITSNDCITVKLSPDYYDHYNQFEKFMLHQPTYQLMILTCNKLQFRLKGMK